jgi:hypothetical protein
MRFSRSHAVGCHPPGKLVVTMCNGATAGYQPTISDTLPSIKAVYDGGSQVKRGF